MHGPDVKPPDSQPRCRFGTAGTVAGSVVDAAHMLCHTPRVTRPLQSMAVEVSLNAQQYTTDAQLYAVYAHPAVSSFSPDRGPVDGGTLVNVSGSGLEAGSSWQCSFADAAVGAELVDDEGPPFVTCYAPPTPAGSAALSRLKVVLAHDRTGLDELTMEKIRAEIQGVVSKYCVVQEDDVRFDLYNDDDMTVVSATFPLRGTLGREGGVAVTVGGGGAVEQRAAAEELP